MARYFVPYAGDTPAAILVNGHRLVILAREAAVLEGHLNEVGADSVKPLNGGRSQREESRILNRIAKSSNAGIVIAPEEVSVSEVIRNLETQLPWLQ